jgi:hypothetical protein
VSAKIEVCQNGTTRSVYDWALHAGENIAEAAVLTRMVLPRTNPAIYFAEIITEQFDAAQAAQEANK